LVAHRRVANEHHENLELDSLRAYHFGSKFMVEAEVGEGAEGGGQRNWALSWWGLQADAV
jgi:hypothetical protein